MPDDLKGKLLHRSHSVSGLTVTAKWKWNQALDVAELWKVCLQTLRTMSKVWKPDRWSGAAETGGWRVWRQRGLHGRACFKNNARKERKKGRRKDGKKKERRKKRRKEVREEGRRESHGRTPIANFGECALCHYLQMSDARDMQIMVMCCPFPWQTRGSYTVKVSPLCDHTGIPAWAILDPELKSIFLFSKMFKELPLKLSFLRNWAF